MKVQLSKGVGRSHLNPPLMPESVDAQLMLSICMRRLPRCLRNSSREFQKHSCLIFQRSNWDISNKMKQAWPAGRTLSARTWKTARYVGDRHHRWSGRPAKTLHATMTQTGSAPLSSIGPQSLGQPSRDDFVFT